MVCGFIKLNGSTVGAVANRTEIYDAEGNLTETMDAVLSARGARKAADFVKFCDAFNIPVLTLTNVTGFLSLIHIYTDYGGNSMFCKYCGNRLEDGDRFCGACGHPVEEKPMQETANEDSYKKQEEKVPHIKKKKPEPEYDNRMTEGMGYGYQMEQHQEDDDDDDEEEWEREEKKEKITFAILGIIIVVLVVAIVFEMCIRDSIKAFHRSCTAVRPSGGRSRYGHPSGKTCRLIT